MNTRLFNDEVSSRQQPNDGSVGIDDGGAVDVTLFSSDGTGALYWWTMAYISGIGSLTSWYIGRHPQFLKPEDRAYWAGLAKTRARLRGVAFFSVFVIAGASTLVLSYLGFYALLLIWPLNWALQPSRAQRAALGSGANADIAPPG